MPARPQPPEVWVPAHRAARRLVSPIQRFLEIEAASGLLLIAASIIALVWANSAWSGAYHDLWHTEVGLRLGPWGFERPLHFWVNDGLMTVFFFVVGLEIRREIHEGELSELRRAALPLAAAIGGMVVPAGIYVVLNHGGAGAAGWGIPMATDIAFAVGVLTLLGKRVPPALRVLLLALAVIDDIGAILVIALFYSSGIEVIGLAVTAGGLAGVLVLRTIGVRGVVPYLAPGVVVWAGMYASGIHPTLAGVMLGMMTPVTAWLGTTGFTDETRRRLDKMDPADSAASRLDHLAAIERARREAVSPTDLLLYQLHGLVAYVIMPVFALANAGVALGGADLSGDGLWVFVGVVAGLALGKPLGVAAAALASTGTGLAVRPRDVDGRGVLVVGVVAGIGFTMSLFVAQLAFPPGPLLETAKLAVLVGSATATVAALVVGIAVLRKQRGGPPPASEAEAEASTDL